MDWRDLHSFSFGDSPVIANELAALVLAGLKTATCWNAADGPGGAEVGKRTVMLNGSGKALAVLETVELFIRQFDEVDETFAFDEGEGDQSLAFWRQAHCDYFGRLGQFTEDMLLYCERFRLVERIVE